MESPRAESRGEIGLTKQSPGKGDTVDGRTASVRSKCLARAF